MESFGTPPETGVQPLLQVDIVALVSTKGIEEFVSSLQPGENQHDEEQLRREREVISGPGENVCLTSCPGTVKMISVAVEVARAFWSL